MSRMLRGEKPCGTLRKAWAAVKRIQYAAAAANAENRNSRLKKYPVAQSMYWVTQRDMSKAQATTRTWLQRTRFLDIWSLFDLNMKKQIPSTMTHITSMWIWIRLIMGSLAGVPVTLD